AEAKLSVDDSDGVVLEDDVERLAGEHSPVLQPPDVGGHADDPVRIVAHEVRLDQVGGDALSFRGLAPCRVKDGRGECAQTVVMVLHHLPRLPGTRRTSAGMRWVWYYSGRQDCPTSPERQRRDVPSLALRAGLSRRWRSGLVCPVAGAPGWCGS